MIDSFFNFVSRTTYHTFSYEFGNICRTTHVILIDESMWTIVNSVRKTKLLPIKVHLHKKTANVRRSMRFHHERIIACNLSGLDEI